MKGYSVVKYTCIVLLALAVGACSSSKKSSTAAMVVQQAMISQRWKFTADQAAPKYGQQGAANGQYAVRFTKNKVKVFLPFFVRTSNGTEIVSDGGPLDFTTIDFRADELSSANGKWVLHIMPHDNRDVQSLQFNIYSNGNASLNVIMNSRAPLSFKGVVGDIE